MATTLSAEELRLARDRQLSDEAKKWRKKLRDTEQQLAAARVEVQTASDRAAAAEGAFRELAKKVKETLQ